MKNQKNSKKPSPQSLLYAFESFGLEASERELDEALVAAGEDPNILLKEAGAAIHRAMLDAKNVAGSCERETATINPVALHRGLQTLVSLLRRKKGLSEEELAESANVDLDEIRKIELESDFAPSPRTIYQLERFFELKPRTLALISGSITSHSSEFTEGVLQFAAHSKEIGKLNREEKKLLNEFVRFLSDELKKRG